VYVFACVRRLAGIEIDVRYLCFVKPSATKDADEFTTEELQDLKSTLPKMLRIQLYGNEQKQLSKEEILLLEKFSDFLMEIDLSHITIPWYKVASRRKDSDGKKLAMSLGVLSQPKFGYNKFHKLLISLTTVWIYLVIGGVVFSAVERPEEERKNQENRNAVS